MMREIIFKGKLIEGSGWITGFLIINNDGTSFIVNNHGGSYTWDEVRPETVGQYIGKKDKTDRAIFDGDILRGKFGSGIGGSTTKYKEMNFSVGFHSNVSGEFFINMPSNYGRYRFCPYLDNSIIIGNIHDNKDLLQSL